MLRKIKLITLALATIMVANISMTAMAAGYTAEEGSTTPDEAGPGLKITSDTIQSHPSAGGNPDKYAGVAGSGFDNVQKKVDVKATFTAGTTTNVVAAALDTTTINLDYKHPTLIWDPVELKYVQTDTGEGAVGWTTPTATVTITNYSDIPLYGIAKVESKLTGAATLTLDETSAFTLDKAGYGEATGTQALQITGEGIVHDISLTGSQSIGTLTIKLQKNGPATF